MSNTIKHFFYCVMFVENGKMENGGLMNFNVNEKKVERSERINHELMKMDGKLKK